MRSYLLVSISAAFIIGPMFVLGKALRSLKKKHTHQKCEKIMKLIRMCVDEDFYDFFCDIYDENVYGQEESIAELIGGYARYDMINHIISPSLVEHIAYGAAEEGQRTLVTNLINGIKDKDGVTLKAVNYEIMAERAALNNHVDIVKDLWESYGKHLDLEKLNKIATDNRRYDMMRLITELTISKIEAIATCSVVA